MAQPRGAAAPAVPAATSTMHLGSPSASAFPHYVLDYESRFRAAVIDDFVDGYARGETPVPCIRCNQRVKFRDLLSVARDLGASALATGHYARRVAGPEGPELHRACDAARDQSYFLFATKREELEFLRFPLGEPHQGRDPCLGAAFRPADRGQARQSGHLLCAERILRSSRRAAAARGSGAGRHRRPQRSRARQAQRHRPFHGRATQGARDRRRRAALCAGDRARRAARRRRSASRIGRNPNFSRRAELARRAGGRRHGGGGEASLDADAGTGEALPSARTPGRPSSFSTRRPVRWRRARRRCSTTATGCSAAAGSAGPA